MGRIKRKKQDFIKFGTKLCGFEGGEKAKVYYKGTGVKLLKKDAEFMHIFPIRLTCLSFISRKTIAEVVTSIDN